MKLDVMLTVPHGAPGNDVLAPFVARALHDQLKTMGLEVRTLISRTCRYTAIDMNRGDGRGSQFRSTVRKLMEETPPKLHIDVHSFPGQVPRFEHQDIVLLHGFEHPDADKPLQDGDWLREYARLLSETGSITACVQPSQYPNDVSQHIVNLGMPRNRTMLAEHHNEGDPVVYAAAHARAIAQVLGITESDPISARMDDMQKQSKSTKGAPLLIADTDEIDLDHAQQHSPGHAGTTGGGGLATPSQHGVEEMLYVGEKYDGRAGPRFPALKKGKVRLTPEERTLVMQRKAVWHHGPKGQETPAVWKSVVNGKTWYVTNTHRAYNVTPTLKGCIKQYHDFIKGTAESVEA